MRPHPEASNDPAPVPAHRSRGRVLPVRLRRQGGRGRRRSGRRRRPVPGRGGGDRHADPQRDRHPPSRRPCLIRPGARRGRRRRLRAVRGRRRRLHVQGRPGRRCDRARQRRRRGAGYPRPHARAHRARGHRPHALGGALVRADRAHPDGGRPRAHGACLERRDGRPGALPQRAAAEGAAGASRGAARRLFRLGLRARPERQADLDHRLRGPPGHQPGPLLVDDADREARHHPARRARPHHRSQRVLRLCRRRARRHCHRLRRDGPRSPDRPARLRPRRRAGGAGPGAGLGAGHAALGACRGGAACPRRARRAATALSRRGSRASDDPRGLRADDLARPAARRDLAGRARREVRRCAGLGDPAGLPLPAWRQPARHRLVPRRCVAMRRPIPVHARNTPNDRRCQPTGSRRRARRSRRGRPSTARSPRAPR